MITKILKIHTEYLNRFLDGTHKGNPFCIFPYSGNTSSDSEEVVNFFTRGTLFSMANELLTWCDLWSSFFSILSLTRPLLYAKPSRHVYKLVIAPLNRVFKSWCYFDPMVLLMEISSRVALSSIMLLPHRWWRDLQWWLEPTGSPAPCPDSDRLGPQSTPSPSPALVHHRHRHRNSLSPHRTLSKTAMPLTWLNPAHCFSRRRMSPRAPHHLISSLPCFLPHDPVLGVARLYREEAAEGEVRRRGDERVVAKGGRE